MRRFAKENEMSLYSVLVAIGVLLRFIVMAVGHNYDFQSYLIVGELLHNGLDVYANTQRYNYGPLFMVFQGLFYEVSTHVLDMGTMYRVLIVAFLTSADVGIMAWLDKHYGKKVALLFFLNPVSIIITGYHNQFDNVAILLMLLAINFYNEEEKIGIKDMAFVFLMALSLTMKHVFAFFAAWILFSKGLSPKKRCLYAVMPPILFLMSFAFPILKNFQNASGILENVFLYRSMNNFPLFGKILEFINVPNSMYTVIFIAIVCVMGWIFRGKEIEERVLWYTMCMVAFSSAVGDHYLAIPMAALSVFGKKLKWFYMLFMGHYLIWHETGMQISSVYPEHLRIPNSGYWGAFFGCFLLAIVIAGEILKQRKVTGGVS